MKTDITNIPMKSHSKPISKLVKSSVATYSPDKQTRLMATFADVERIRYSAQRELELARKIRTEAERYQQETETRARSQAQLLILQTRLETKKEIAALKQKTSEEIQKMLADIRMIRINAQEELEIQRRFTNAARIHALSLNLQEDVQQKTENTKEAVGA